MAAIKLTKEQIADLKKGERDLNEIITEVDKLESCGVDCQAYRDAIQEALERSTKIRQVYGPKVSE